MKKIGLILLYTTIVFSLVMGFFYLVAKHPDEVGVGIFLAMIFGMCGIGGREIYRKLHK